MKKTAEEILNDFKLLTIDIIRMCVNVPEIYSGSMTEKSALKCVEIAKFYASQEREGIEQLIEDYKRYLKSVSDALVSFTSEKGISNTRRLEGLQTKFSEYKLFISELEKILNPEL